jgi:FlaA1/EpsC-like NDP-sugar epimerase
MLTFKRLIVILYDFITIPIAWFGAYWIRYNLTDIPLHTLTDVLDFLPIVMVVQLVFFWIYGLYRGHWRFASLHDLMRICRSAIISTVVIFIIIYFFVSYFFPGLGMPPRSIYPLYVILLIFLLGGARLFFRWLKEFQWRSGYGEKVLIVGAGFAGEALVRDLRRDIHKQYYPECFVDDDPHKVGTDILGIRVRGRITDIPKLVEKYAIQQILIAIPAASAEQMRRIVNYCRKARIPYRTLPGLSALATGKVTVKDLREVSVEDLLGREPIDINDASLQHAFSNKKVLVTGGGGSIGSELCRQISFLGPKQLIIVEHSEYNLYQIEMELRLAFPQAKIIPCLQSITDAEEIERVMIQYQPDIIFHAAAYKHVPLLEEQALVAVKNNILGTRIMVEAANRHKVEKFILISTDKAVNPANVMGASKRVAEMFCQSLNAHSNTKFITVRFGNVLGSAGSVVPLFQKQLAQGGPLTVTHPDITRYFMTIPEACQLILHASQLGQGGEIFVLDMGEPIKINYLAEQVIELSGKKLGEDIEIKYTGLRPGEKLYEELFHKNEELAETTHEKIFQASARNVNLEQLMQHLNELADFYRQGDLAQSIQIIRVLVPEASLENNPSH